MTFYILITILGLLQIADLFLTHRALELGAREANPMMAWLINKVGNMWVAGIGAKAPIFLLVLWCESIPLTVFGIALMTWVCWNNAQVVKRLRGNG